MVKLMKKFYVSQPPGFIDPKYPQKVYKVVKALYGLHQAPRAWYLKEQTQTGPFVILSVLIMNLEAYSDSDYLEQILTGNPQQEVVNFLAGDLFLGNARSRPLWLLQLQRQNIFAAGKLLWAIATTSLRELKRRNLIQCLKSTHDDNVADLLTKAFDVSRPIVSTGGSKVSTDKEKDSIDRTDEDETIGTGSSQHESKPKQFQEDEGKGGKRKLEREKESESESDGIPEVEKKFKRLASDEEMARKVQEEWESEEERKRLAKEEATNDALIRNYDDIKARIEADRLLAEKLQEEEREQFTIEERAKFLHDTIAAQRKFLAQQRSEAIRNRPPTKNQLRNQMMTYLKHVGNFKHSDLKTKKFEEIQALYEKIKRSDEDFISIGSAEDERLIKKMNEKGIDSSKNEMVKEESKEEESTRKRKLGTRKKMKSRKRRFIQNTSEDDSEKENDELRLCLTIAPDEDKEVDYEILDKKYPIIEWKTEYLGTKPQVDKAKHLEEINQNVVIRSNGQKRYFSTLMRVLSIFDRDDLNAVYQLVMDKYQDEIPEGFDRVLWGDLMIMFNPDDEDKFWNSQQD
ncbi:ribonuclease H-like domain-containing protein [Tanacetum coccineum]